MPEPHETREDPPRPPLHLESGGHSATGRVRTANQDARGEALDEDGNRVLVVADGIGGHAASGVASRICVESVCREFHESRAALDERLQLALQQANADVFEAASGDLELAGMGTTAVALAVEPAGRAWVAWVGDSRAYRLRAGELVALTEDHSWIAGAVRSGRIDASEVAAHPRRNELLRCIGTRAVVDVEQREVDTLPGDRFLLCSDGLWSELPPEEIEALLSRGGPAASARALVDRANERGGRDNVTVQVLSLQDPNALPLAREGRPLRQVVAVGVLATGLTAVAAWALLDPGPAFPPQPVAQKPVAVAESVAPPSEDDLRELERRALDAQVVEIGRAPAPGAEPEPPPVVAAPLGVSPPGSLSPVSSGPLRPRADFPEPSPPPAPVQSEVDTDVGEFVESWRRSVVEQDFGVYRQLGFRASREQFAREYGAPGDRSLRFDLVAAARQPDGTIHARVQVHSGPEADPELQAEHRIRLRPSPQGLRYLGDY